MSGSCDSFYSLSAVSWNACVAADVAFVHKIYSTYNRFHAVSFFATVNMKLGREKFTYASKKKYNFWLLGWNTQATYVHAMASDDSVLSFPSSSAAMSSAMLVDCMKT